MVILSLRRNIPQELFLAGLREFRRIIARNNEGLIRKGKTAYTLARKGYIHKILFSELTSRKMTFQN